MRAVVVKEPGAVQALEVVDVPRPAILPHQILVRNFAAALNRADLLQRRGLYPPPPGESDILGLEFAGEVAEAGREVKAFRRGDRVFGLVGGGAYAEFVAADARLVLPIGDHFSFEAAAATPEAFAAAHEGLRELGRLRPGECALIHAGASGVGSAAIQLARALGATALATVGTAEKAELCRGLGAQRAVNYREENFLSAVEETTGGRGVDLVLDLVGAGHAASSLAALSDGGRWVLLGLLGGARAEVDLGLFLRKRLELRATTLRHRSFPERLALKERFARDVLPLLESGEVRPVIDSVYMLEDVRDAHERMEANRNLGKIVLRL